jgi:hypothetical protein
VPKERYDDEIAKIKKLLATSDKALGDMVCVDVRPFIIHAMAYWDGPPEAVIHRALVASTPIGILPSFSTKHLLILKEHQQA